MAEFLRRNERQVRENERLLIDGIDARMQHVTGLRTLDIDATSWIAGALGSVGVGYGAVAGSRQLPAPSASPAQVPQYRGCLGLLHRTQRWHSSGWQPGGRWGGMALGVTALNFVTVGPALLVGGFVAHMQGDKALTDAQDVCAKIEVGIAELDEFDAKLSAVDGRVSELSLVLEDTRERAVAALDVLESEPFDAKAHADRFQRAMTMAMAVRDIAAAPVIDESGDLTEESADLTVKYRTMTEENADA